MSTRKDGAALVGIGAAACAVCCAGPLLGFLAAIGLGTIAGVALFGAVGLVATAIGVLLVLRRRRRQSVACRAETRDGPVAVESPLRRRQPRKPSQSPSAHRLTMPTVPPSRAPTEASSKASAPASMIAPSSATN